MDAEQTVCFVASAVRTVERMASLRVLVEDMATALGISGPTIAATAKKLRENNLIRTSGRGTSAALMTKEDAAHLLCAIICSHSIAEAPELTRRGLKLKYRGKAIRSPARSAIRQRLKQEKIKTPLDAVTFSTFEESLVALIESAASEADETVSEPKRFSEIWSRNAITIRFVAPISIAVISVVAEEGSNPDEDVVIRYVFYSGQSELIDTFEKFRLQDLEYRLNGAGFSESRTITGSIFKAIAISLNKAIKTK